MFGLAHGPRIHMFEQKAALFFYAVSPVHLGMGSALGVVDNPIQRERHTGHPVFAGSGIKGAVRELWEASGEPGQALARRYFGPDTTSAGDYAGAISFSDAQLLLFPIRAARRAFVYATCPTALARARRLLEIAGAANGLPMAPPLGADQALVANDAGLLQGGKLGLEWHAQPAAADKTLAAIGAWLAAHALPGGEAHAHFRGLVQNDLVLISDEDFGFFVRQSTSIEPHVRIDDASGTADAGGLFYTENLPPESLLIALVMASRERGRNGRGAPAQEVLKALRTGSGLAPHLDGSMLQIGGDATTGRGHVCVRFAEATQ